VFSYSICTHGPGVSDISKNRAVSGEDKAEGAVASRTGATDNHGMEAVFVGSVPSTAGKPLTRPMRNYGAKTGP